MNPILAAAAAYIISHLTEASDEIRVKFAEVVAFVEGKQAQDAAVAQAEVDRVAAEVADLIAKGYAVTAPVVAFASTPVAQAVSIDINTQSTSAGEIASEFGDAIAEPVADAPAV